MIRTRIIKEELHFLIYIPRDWGYNAVGSYDVPEKIFYDQPFTTNKIAERYLALAKKQHKKHPHHIYAEEPILEKYWKILSEETKND